MMHTSKDAIYDLLGVGIGPSNLSTAALLNEIEGMSSHFYDAKPEFNWHPGMLFPEASIQVSYLKDLVSLVDPTNPWSFINFLVRNKRIYRFVTAAFPCVRRKEFNQYYRWACTGLDNLSFGTKVEALHFERDHFVLQHEGGSRKARNIALGTGLSKRLPHCLEPLQSGRVLHAIDFLKKQPDYKDKRVVIIGGGQSGAELFNHLIADTKNLPAKLHWVSGRANMLPIDDSPFANEYFFPGYSDYFFQLKRAEKKQLVQEQNLASDGINHDLLQSIYQQLYHIEVIEGRKQLAELLVNHRVTDTKHIEDSYTLFVQKSEQAAPKTIEADIVICATGFEYRIPALLEPLMDRIKLQEGHYVFRDDYSIEWDGPAANKIFVQNGARNARGVADPNLSLMAWRSAKIINSVMGHEHFDMAGQSCVIDWQQTQAVSKGTNGHQHIHIPIGKSIDNDLL